MRTQESEAGKGGVKSASLIWLLGWAPGLQSYADGTPTTAPMKSGTLSIYP